MATSPEHMDDLIATPAKGARPPITANPAFPWIVALWCAALLGIGSFVLPVAVLERISTASGLASALPAAAPPLGFTAQSLMALVGTLAGGVLGFMLARKLAAPRTRAISDRNRLISEDDVSIMDLEPDGFDAFGDTPLARRRSLAIEEEDGYSDFLEIAPVPGEGSVPEPRLVDAQLAEHWHEDDLPQPDTETGEPEELPVEMHKKLIDEELIDEAGAAPEPFEVPASPEPVEDEIARPEPSGAAGPLPFSPPSMARYNPPEDHDGEETEAEVELDSEPETVFDPVSDVQESEDSVSDNQDSEKFQPRDYAPAPVEPDTLHEFAPAENVSLAADDGETAGQDEGLVQLVQRLEATLEKHREWSAGRASAGPMGAPAALTLAQEPSDVSEEDAEPPLPDEFDPAPAEEAVQATAAYFGSAPPAAGTGDGPPFGALAGIAEKKLSDFNFEAGFDDDEENEHAFAASLTLPTMKLAQTPPAERPAFDRPPASPEPEEGIGNQPAVLFPNQHEDQGSPAGVAADPGLQFPQAARPRPSNDDHDRALREALMNLQRMGK